MNMRAGSIELTEPQSNMPTVCRLYGFPKIRGIHPFGGSHHADSCNYFGFYVGGPLFRGNYHMVRGRGSLNLFASFNSGTSFLLEICCPPTPYVRLIKVSRIGQTLGAASFTQEIRHFQHWETFSPV